MGDIIERNQSPEPSEASSLPAAGANTLSTAAVEVPAYQQRPTFGQLLRTDLGFIPVLLTLLVIVAFFTIVSGGVFLHPENLSNLVGGGQIVPIGILGLGQIFVLLLGEIDLSIASVGTLCAVIMAVLAERMGVPGWEAILVGLLSGAILGFINGVFVAVLRVPSFIVTLAGFIGYAGLLLHLLNGQSTLIITDPTIVGIAGTPISFLPDVWGVGLPLLVVLLYIVWLFINFTRRRSAGLRTVGAVRLIVQIVVSFVLVAGAVAVFESYQGIPYATAIFFALLVLSWLLLTKTAFGRHFYAVGGNAEAARRAGINVVGIRLAAFTLCSLFAAIGGIIQASHGLAVASQVSPTLLLDAIASAVIGGVSLFGGSGSAWSIVLGVLIIGSLENGLALESQGADVSQMVEGGVLIIAVTMDAILRRVQKNTGR
jgi:D-xylose transport system permease protein